MFKDVTKINDNNFWNMESTENPFSFNNNFTAVSRHSKKAKKKHQTITTLLETITKRAKQCTTTTRTETRRATIITRQLSQILEIKTKQCHQQWISGWSDGWHNEKSHKAHHRRQTLGESNNDNINGPKKTLPHSFSHTLPTNVQFVRNHESMRRSTLLAAAPNNGSFRRDYDNTKMTTTIIEARSVQVSHGEMCATHGVRTHTCSSHKCMWR